MLNNSYELSQFFSVKNLVVLITGAAGQLGRKTVNIFLGNQAKVIAVDLNFEMLQKAAKEEGWQGNNIKLLSCDIRKLQEVQKTFEEGIRVFGDINILINNAGVSVFESFLEREEDSIDWVMDVNLKGTFFCIREFIKHCEHKKHGGNIVNIASIYGIISPDPRIYTDCERKNSEIYGATKAGVIQMTKYFSVHAAPYDIRVNAISLGGIRNPTNPQGEDFQKNYGFRCPMGRMAEINEIMGSILFLSSPAASYITGHNLIIDGGMSAW